MIRPQTDIDIRAYIRKRDRKRRLQALAIGAGFILLTLLMGWRCGSGRYIW